MYPFGTGRDRNVPFSSVSNVQNSVSVLRTFFYFASLLLHNSGVVGVSSRVPRGQRGKPYTAAVTTDREYFLTLLQVIVSFLKVTDTEMTCDQRHANIMSAAITITQLDYAVSFELFLSCASEDDSHYRDFYYYYCHIFYTSPPRFAVVSFPQRVLRTVGGICFCLCHLSSQSNSRMKR